MAFVGNVILVVICSQVTTAVVVRTRDGLVQGRKLEYNGTQYHSFQGIRYARPPTGNLRFKPPVPVQPWYDVADAREQGPSCPQSGNYNFSQMSEDCLFLNVYTPVNYSGDSNSPVLFWIPGGEFSGLSGNEEVYGPQLLMQKGIILVTTNYRLGALGFLSLDMEGASGNAGLKDVTLALEWIRRNIKAFGGDAKQITAGGNSAGAAIAHYLMLSTKTNGLFQRVLLVSGSALGYRFISRDPVSTAFALGRKLSIDTEDKNLLLNQLMSADPIQIVNATKEMGDSDDRKGFRPFSPFVPIVEVDSPHAFITEEPIVIVKRGIPQNYPVLAGFNEDEGIKMMPAINSDPSLIGQLNENFERCIPTDIEYPEGSDASATLARQIKEFYFKNENIDDNINNLVKLLSDTQFTHAIDYWIRLHKNNVNSEVVYYYKFKYDGELNWFKIRNKVDYPGTAHADELGYLFLTAETKPHIDGINGTTREMLNNMLQTVTNFVKFGSPNPYKASKQPVHWEQYDVLKENYFHLEPMLRNSEKPPIRNRTLFWEKIYTDFYNKFPKG